MEDDDLNYLIAVIVLISSLFCGTIFGMVLGEKSATRESVKMCIEKPADCKTKYDYFKIEEQK